MITYNKYYNKIKDDMHMYEYTNIKKNETQIIFANFVRNILL